ncbi:MAG: NAD-dependent epimerase/dehydratase [Acidimicrobiaceae bacterium]|nr:NAD-dependent epimerase/dehydratase [Acidimicrobiaceae bacterium]
MRILVTGGAGFIGSHLVDELVLDGHDVVVLDSLASPVHAERPRHLNDRASYVVGDIRDRGVLDETLPGVEAVAHLAAKVGLETAIVDATAYVSHNDLGTATLLESLAGSGFRGRLVLASSMVVYGEGRYRCAEHGVVAPGPRLERELVAGHFEPPCPECGSALGPETVSEDAPLDPRNVYAATKVHQEHLCWSWARMTGGSAIALRYHNVYGPRMPRNTPYAGVASLFLSRLREGLAPLVYEDGEQRRDFVHVTDVSHATALALVSPVLPNGPMNIGSGVPSTVLEMAEALAHATNGDTRKPVVTGQYRLGDVRHIFASSAKARANLDFTAAITLQDGIESLLTDGALQRDARWRLSREVLVAES